MRNILFSIAAVLSLQISAQSFNAIVNTEIPDDGTDISFDIEVTGLPEVIDTPFG